jgi:hypothetical protein
MSENNYATKIAALLAKAESSDHEAEAKIFRDKAQELMLKWGIDDAMVQDAGVEKPEPIVMKYIDMKGQWHMGFFYLGQSVAFGMGNLKVLISRMDSNKWTRLYVVGHESDVARYTTLVESLKGQAEAAMKEWWKGERKTRGYMYDANTGWTAKRQFIMSFGQGVAAVLREQRSGLVETGSSTDLVLVSRGARVEEFYSNMSVGKARGRGVENGSWSAQQHGFRAGQRASTSSQPSIG